MLGVSFLTPQQIRRLSLIVFAVRLVLVAPTLFFGVEIKGARRWLIIFGVNIQPSEFMKPAFVILSPGCSANPPSARTCRPT